MSTHARLSPSARHRWGACPASIRVYAQYERTGESSPAAVDGTHSHTLLEACLRTTPPIDPSNFLNLTLHDHDGSFVVCRERIERVRVAVDFIKSQLTPDSVLLSESTVNPEALLGRGDMMGTVDVQIRTGSHLHLIDYKDGMTPVEAVDNAQLEQYAYGVLADNIADFGSISTIAMTIIQPKLAVKGLPVVSTWNVGVGDLISERMIHIMEQAEATDDPDAPFVPGDKQCMFCAHKGNCSAFNTWALDKAGIKFEDMNVIQDAGSFDPATTSDEQLRELVESAPLIRKMIEAAEDEALARIQSGRPVHGLKVVRGVGRRQWRISENELEGALFKYKIPKSVIWQTSIISPTQLEKTQWEKRDGTKVTLKPSQWEKLQHDLITKSEGKLTVVSENDRRDAVSFDTSSSIAQMFEPVLETPSWM